MKPRKGTVYLVGAGPGDPGLITVKGFDLLRQADVIVYDDLIPRVLLQAAKAGAELVLAGKRPKGHAVLQLSINRTLLEKARQKKIVVRLKGGDPCVFGRGGEEAVYLRARKIRVEMIPGVSSAFAVPESAGIPVTHRNYVSSVAVITGHRKPGRAEEGGGVEVPDAGTLIYLMCVANLEKIIEAVRRRRKSEDIACAVIERGTTSGQRVVIGTLKDIVRKARAAGIRPPAVLIAGKTVDLRKRIQGRKS